MCVGNLDSFHQECKRGVGTSSALGIARRFQIPCNLTLKNSGCALYITTPCYFCNIPVLTESSHKVSYCVFIV